MREMKNMRKALWCIFLALTFASMTCISACSREVSWISVEPKSVELKEVGETFQLQFVGLDKENKPVDTAVFTCESSNPKVAEVDNNGLITAKGSGNTVISIISENGEKAVVQCKVAITSAIHIEPAELTLQVGEKYELDAQVVDEKGDPAENQIVSWASSDESVAMVNDFGEVSGVSPGETIITGTQLRIYERIEVTVRPLE
jgi:uncharacterized protein YjdB